MPSYLFFPLREDRVCPGWQHPLTDSPYLTSDLYKQGGHWELAVLTFTGKTRPERFFLKTPQPGPPPPHTPTPGLGSFLVRLCKCVYSSPSVIPEKLSLEGQFAAMDEGCWSLGWTSCLAQATQLDSTAQDCPGREARESPEARQPPWAQRHGVLVGTECPISVT